MARPPPVCPSRDEDVPVLTRPRLRLAHRTRRCPPGHALLPERHQHAAVRIHLEDLVAAVVGDPEVAGSVYGQLVRAHEHPGAERLQQLARCVELKDRIDGRARAPARRAAGAGIAAPVDHPDRAVGPDGDARCRSPLAPGRQFAEISAGLGMDWEDRSARWQGRRGQRHRILARWKYRLLRVAPASNGARRHTARNTRAVLQAMCPAAWEGERGRGAGLSATLARRRRPI